MAMLSETRIRALDETDGMSASMRECVHEFGIAVVHACLDAGVTEPRRIRQLVNQIWHGARESGEQRGGARNTLEWLLIQNKGSLSLSTLLRVLHDNSYALVPVEATRAILDASMNEVSGFNVRVTREEKHRRRYRAAVRAGMDEMMRANRR